MTTEPRPGNADLSGATPTSGGSAGERNVVDRTQSDRSLSELFSRLTSDVSTLFREELELAKVELRAEAKQAGKAAGKLGAAGVIGLIAALLLSWALAFLIAEVLPTWAGFAIVGAIYAIVAAVMGMNGKKELDKVDPTPRQTVDTLQEDKEWLKNR